ncbi:MAG: M48 family metalloprotease [Bacteroidales bacterium]|nr:M48 family metalloprotease [Bacteroidales bacterium]
MKKLVIILTAALTLCGCSILQSRNWDTQQLLVAAANATTAVTLTDSQIQSLSNQTVAELDAKSTIDNGTYIKRLNKIMNGIDSAEGLPLNFKVYKTSEINAFACGDGSIRVYSGLMDAMTDEEVFAIIGHEIGHVVHKDTKKAMQNAYMAAAARSTVSAAGGTVGKLAQSVLGDIAEAFVGAQFSQKQEFNADDYGYSFSVANGRSPYAMYNALNKLLTLSNGSKASALQKMFSSHPDTETRAARIKAKADAATGKSSSQ